MIVFVESFGVIIIVLTIFQGSLLVGLEHLGVHTRSLELSWWPTAAPTSAPLLRWPSALMSGLWPA